MSWADRAIKELRAGNETAITPHGGSMKGLVESGDHVKLAPCDPTNLKIDDIVLVRVKGRVYLHLIKAIDKGRYLIGNNRGGINGWVGRKAIYGIKV